jgi:hypothetical protein
MSHASGSNADTSAGHSSQFMPDKESGKLNSSGVMFTRLTELKQIFLHRIVVHAYGISGHLICTFFFTNLLVIINASLSSYLVSTRCFTKRI